MKTLLSVIGATALAVSAYAIPQTFNNNGFLGDVGQNVEDVVGNPAAFEPGVEPKGQWAKIRGKPGAERLTQDAVVFGIPATAVLLHRDGKRITSYEVIYEARQAKAGKAQPSLEERVLAGVRAFTGQSATTKAPAIHQGVNIRINTARNGDVTVAFSLAK